MASVASAAATTIVDPFSVRGSLLDNSIIRYCRAEWQVVIYGAHIHAGLPLKSLKIMRNPVSSTTRLLVFLSFSFFFSSSTAFTREYRMRQTEWRTGSLGETSPLVFIRADIIDDRLDNQQSDRKEWAFLHRTYDQYFIFVHDAIGRTVSYNFIFDADISNFQYWVIILHFSLALSLLCECAVGFRTAFRYLHWGSRNVIYAFH